MAVPQEIRNLTRGVIDSFDSGIGAVGLMIEKGLELLDGYHREQEAVRGNLREKLATIGSLRKKDFDELIERVLGFQLQRETEIKSLIKEFLAKQKELTARMRRSLEAGIFSEVQRTQRELEKMIEGARLAIVSFQGEQEMIRTALSGFEGRDVSAREFKVEIQALEERLLDRIEEQRQTAIGT